MVGPAMAVAIGFALKADPMVLVDLEKAGLVRKEYAYRPNGSFTSNRYYLL